MKINTSSGKRQKDEKGRLRAGKADIGYGKQMIEQIKKNRFNGQMLSLTDES